MQGNVDLPNSRNQEERNQFNPFLIRKRQDNAEGSAQLGVWVQPRGQAFVPGGGPTWRLVPLPLWMFPRGGAAIDEDELESTNSLEYP